MNHVRTDNDPANASLAPLGSVPLVDKPDDRPGRGPTDRTRGARRRPVVPPWARSPRELRRAARWAGGYVGHVSAYHAIRAPWYAVRLALQAPFGAARFVGGSLRWVADAEGGPLRQAAASREDVEEYLKLSRQRDRRVRWRTVVGVLAVIFGAVTVLALYVLGPAWMVAACGTALTLAFGRLGQPEDAPIIHRAVEIPRATRLTSDIVLRALGALGIPAINQAQAKSSPGFAFTAPITRDGPGWLAEGDLPYGVTVADVLDRREKLASGLRRPLGCVWPEAVPDEHTGRLRLWVGDQDMSRTRQPKWPLLEAKPLDLFKPQPFATDQRGRWVAQTLMYVSGIVGAVPRMGKTFLLRLVLLIACMDLRAEIHAYDLKGTGDLSALGRVAHRYRAGEEEDDIAYALTDLRGLRAELRRRAKVIRELPKDLCPESKVTSALADRKSLGLHPIVIGVDECQKWFEHPQHGAEFEEHCTDLVKRGPALGITLLLATQRPDSKSLPTGISANATVRWCLKVMGQIENDMVLGTGSYKRGIRANTLTWADKGIAWFVGEGADARIVRCVELNAPTSDALALRIHELRKRAGMLSGHALGEEILTGAASYDLLTDLVAALPPGKAKAWSEDIVAWLAELRPEVYGQWTPEQLAAAVKPYGLRTVQVWGTTDGKGANRRGLRRDDVLKALAVRDGGSAAA
ncbi:MULTISPECIES: cell division protein FtsK [unclassified Streptomyces]|uniref:cell division protein FtsK n=1 Tax=unclassified Streptomyces TaxID=2593676 RepID=UPI002E28725C|nr:cell division protein FtsK [Streptomyces sp. NBC_00223]